MSASRAAQYPESEAAERDRRDRRLLDGVRSGDVDALQSLIADYWRPLLGYAHRLLGDADGANDLVQEAFVRFWERREALRLQSSGRILLYTIVRNLASNDRRSAAIRGRDDLVRRIPRPPPPATPADLLEARELKTAMERAIEALPPRRREVLLLAKFDELSRQEIADLLGLSSQTVANHLGLAITELKERLRLFLA